MPIQQLIKTPIFINQYPIVTQIPGIINNDAAGVLKPVVTPFSVNETQVWSVVFYFLKRKYFKNLKNIISVLQNVF